MRVTSDFFVSALIRRVFSSGGFAAVQRRGSPEAGAVFCVCRQRDGTLVLIGPAPQTSYGEEVADRRFAILATDLEEVVEARIAKESRFDSDLWVVEIEPGSVPLGELLAIAPS